MSNREGDRGARGREEPLSPEHPHDCGGMADEDRAWLESDLSHLSGFEQYEWAEGELEAGEPVRYVPGFGAVAGGPGGLGAPRDRGASREDEGAG